MVSFIDNFSGDLYLFQINEETTKVIINAVIYTFYEILCYTNISKGNGKYKTSYRQSKLKY